MHEIYTTTSNDRQVPPLNVSASNIAISQATSGAPADTAGWVAVAFLRWLDPTGVHRVVAFDVSGNKTFPVCSITTTLEGDGAERIAAFVDLHNGKYNLYFQVNELRPDFSGLSAKDDDIAWIRAIPADKDPRAGIQPGDLEPERVRMLTFLADKLSECPPSGFIDSGNGFWVFYRLEKKLQHTRETGDRYRAQCRGLLSALDSDNVINPSRVARLPGTTNLPDANKRAKGRPESQAKVLKLNGQVFNLAAIEAAFPPDWSTPEEDKDPRIQVLRDELRHSAHEAVYERTSLGQYLLAKLEAGETASSKFRAFFRGDYSGTAAADGTGKRAAVTLLIAHHCKPENVEEFAALIWLWAVTVEGIDYAEEKLTARDIARLYARKVEPTMQANAEKAADRASIVDRSFERDVEVAEANVPTHSADGGQPEKALRRLPLTPFRKAAETALDYSNKPLVRGLLDQGTLSVIYGPSNVGKTFVVLDIAFHIATGLSWGGMETTKGTVLYVAAEGGPGARKRARALQKRFGLEGKDVEIELVLSTINLLDPKADLEPLIATMGDLTAADRPVIFLVIDTFSRVFAGGEENGSTDMGTMVAHFDRIRQATAAHVCIVHHSGKQIAKGARGHSLLRAATDTEIEVLPNRIVVTKQRDLEGNYAADFRLVQVEIGKASDGAAVTSAIVELVNRGGGAPGVATPAEEGVLDAIKVVRQSIDVAEAQTFRLDDVLPIIEANGVQMSKDGLRKHLSQLTVKRLLRSAGRGAWALPAPENAHSAFFQHINPDEAVQTISEDSGVGNGASVFG